MYICKCRKTDNYSFHWSQSGRGPRGDWSSPLLLDAKCLVISDQSERVLGMLLSFLCRPCYCPVRGVVWPLGWPLITIWESPLLSITYMTPISFSYFVCSEETRCDLRWPIQWIISRLLLYPALDRYTVVDATEDIITQPLFWINITTKIVHSFLWNWRFS